MNRFFNSTFTLCVFCGLAAGCSNLPGPQEAGKIAVYEAIPLDPRPYKLVKRIWVASGRSAGIVPKFDSTEEGAAALRNRAVALGGDAVMNFGCYRLDADIAPDSHPTLICNGNVIKYLQ
ncbi:MAG TPA: hypothetical protein VIF38_09480 [Burkholderiales bacterium]|jgi:hypothetical protein